MLILNMFSAEVLPKHFAQQMRDFARIEWQNDITHDIETTLHPAHWHPIYFVLAENETLISAAAVLWKMVEFQGEMYTVYGLGMVLTYPAYRQQGHGRRVVAAATEFIRYQDQADFAILQTAPHLEQFYAEHGWQHTPKIRILSGPPENPIDDDGWIMTLFLSDRAQKNRSKFEATPFYLDTDIW